MARVKSSPWKISRAEQFTISRRGGNGRSILLLMSASGNWFAIGVRKSRRS